MVREGPRIRLSPETGTMASPIEETARADTLSVPAPATAARMTRWTLAQTSAASSSALPGPPVKLYSS